MVNIIFVVKLFFWFKNSINDLIVIENVSYNFPEVPLEIIPWYSRYVLDHLF